MKRPVKCFVCGKRMYYFGEKEWEEELRIFHGKKEIGFAHLRCLKKGE